MEVLKYGASRLVDHVSGEEATEFIKNSIALEEKSKAEGS
jgi:hypothetical protein